MIEDACEDLPRHKVEVSDEYQIIMLTVHEHNKRHNWRVIRFKDD